MRGKVLTAVAAALVCVAGAETPASASQPWPVNTDGKGCPPPVWTSPAPPNDPRRILVIGDSITRMTHDLTYKKLSEAGWLVSVRCWGGMGAQWGVEQVHAARKYRQLPQTVVVALGTNDVWWRGVSISDSVDMMMQALGPKRSVYWVNLRFGPSPYPDLPSHGPANKVLRSKLAEYPNLKLINFASAWQEAARQGKPVGWDDGVHLNVTGGRVRVNAIVEAVGRPQSTPPPSPLRSPQVLPAEGL